jgi:hypothetical protein
LGHGLHHLSTLVASLPPLEDRLTPDEGVGFWEEEKNFVFFLLPKIPILKNV